MRKSISLPELSSNSMNCKYFLSHHFHALAVSNHKNLIGNVATSNREIVSANMMLDRNIKKPAHLYPGWFCQPSTSLGLVATSTNNFKLSSTSMASVKSNSIRIKENEKACQRKHEKISFTLMNRHKSCSALNFVQNLTKLKCRSSFSVPHSSPSFQHNCKLSSEHTFSPTIFNVENALMRNYLHSKRNSNVNLPLRSLNASITLSRRHTLNSTCSNSRRNSYNEAYEHVPCSCLRVLLLFFVGDQSQSSDHVCSSGFGRILIGLLILMFVIYMLFFRQILALSDVSKEDKEVPPQKFHEFSLQFNDEVIVAEAKHVHKFAPLRAQKAGILGTLFVTNFKISFVTTSLPVDTKESELHCACLHSDFLGLHDISLTEIDAVYCMLEGSKKKKLHCTSPLPNKIKGLHIVLKNFRSIIFSFGLTPDKGDIKVTNALLVHRYPKRIDLFYLALDSPPPYTGIPEFRLSQEWEKELKRTRCPNWRISRHNENHKAFPSLPAAFVVPHGITDSELANASHHFRGNRPPVWCWGTPRGAALVRMAQVSPTITTNTSVENHLMKMIHKSHSQKVQPTIIDLDQELPPLKSIQLSYAKLKDLHTPDSLIAYRETEKYYLSRWQSSGWLSHIQQCLAIAQKASSSIAINNSSVILQEGEGRDMSCVISSLIQIILDPFARTLRGLHTLIQKEWVALGHPFSMRLGHLKHNTEDVCPVWLLFLDCVHQISFQCPSALEFTSDYLSALWQASHCSLHSTFMFDSIKEKLYAYTTVHEESRLQDVFFWPVWSWWNRSEGHRMCLRKGSLHLQKENLIRRQVEHKKRLSSISTITMDNETKEGLILGQQIKELKSEEKDIQSEESSFEREDIIRNKARERFINALYIQSLIEPILTPLSLSHISDPIASAHNAWHRLYHIMGKGKTPLPYDPTLPPSLLELDQVLKVPSNFVMRPWIECFGMWMSEPSLVSQVERSVEPCQNSMEHHWKIIHEIFNILQKHYATSVVNGATS